MKLKYESTYKVYEDEYGNEYAKIYRADNTYDWFSRTLYAWNMIVHADKYKKLEDESVQD